MEPLGDIIRSDRIAQGLSLKGLALSLNKDRSLGLDRKVTPSWLHHLEKGRAKTLSTAMKKGIARALRQEETKYLDPGEFSSKGRHTFAKFFDEQLSTFEAGSTLIGDFVVDPERVQDVGELLLCLYQFLVVVDGRLVIFERSPTISLPVLLLAIRSWPSIDDSNPHEVISEILAPAAAGGFLRCPLPSPSPAALAWVTSKVEVYESSANDQAAVLLETDPFCRLGVISPSRDGSPVKRFFYYLHPREYGILRETMAEKAHQRFTSYRDRELFTRCAYEPHFAFSYREMAQHYHLEFDSLKSRVAGQHRA